jgi:hypothetical protein
MAMLHTYQSIYSYVIPGEIKHSRRDFPVRGIHGITIAPDNEIDTDRE